MKNEKCRRRLNHMYQKLLITQLISTQFENNVKVEKFTDSLYKLSY